MKRLQTCVTPDGKFQYGIHKPAYSVTNLRPSAAIEHLGLTEENEPVNNESNYPTGQR